MEQGQIAVDAVIVDFDGTVCPDDVSDAIVLEFAGDQAVALNEAYEAGRIGSLECLVGQVSLLRASIPEMVQFAVRRFPVDPTFAPFAAWCAGRGLPLTVVSDGLGFHVAPLLEKAGVDGLEVITNHTIEIGGRSTVSFPHGHHVCRQCATCKMRAVLDGRERIGRVAFVGDGLSDRYGSVYADLVFAKGALAAYCRTERISFTEWWTFDDVRARLERAEPAPGPVGPEQCPGWRIPDERHRGTGAPTW